mmetsp:Transcript_413/g.830  ORF Transcript_413/g.830 Transcript_413/m.830 type:complete len:210 (+) Transcript_413:648-1277(+)
MVLHRRARQCEAALTAKREYALRCECGGIAYHMCLVQNQHRPTDLLQRGVPPESVIGDDQHVRGGEGWGGFLRLPCPLCCHKQCGEVAAYLALPVEDQRCGADDQGGACCEVAFDAQHRESGQRLQSFTQTHLVRQHAAEAQSAQVREPRDPVPLVAAQLRASQTLDLSPVPLLNQVGESRQLRHDLRVLWGGALADAGQGLLREHLLH